MNIEETAAAIRDIAARVKDGESKSIIYASYKDTPIAAQVERQLSNLPTLSRRTRFGKLNSMLVGLFFLLAMVRFIYFSKGASKLTLFEDGAVNTATLWRHGLMLISAMLVPLFLYRQKRFGYLFALFLPIYYVYAIGRFYSYHAGLYGDVLVSGFLGVAIVCSALACYVGLNLFPDGRMFKHVRDAEGNVVFED